MECKQRLRTLWRDTNKAEQTLWQALQNPQTFAQLSTCKFCRHVVIGDFFVDFVCHELKLAIELYSGVSEHSSQKAERVCALQYKGFLVIHISHQTIQQNLISVIEQLALILNQRQFELLR